jgi:hypothetical protein
VCQKLGHIRNFLKVAVIGLQKITYCRRLTDIHRNANVYILRNMKALSQEKGKEVLKEFKNP